MILPRLIGSPSEILMGEISRGEFIDRIGDRITNWSEDSPAYEKLMDYSLASQWYQYHRYPDLEVFLVRVDEIKKDRIVDAATFSLHDRIAEEKAKFTAENKVYAIVHHDRIIVHSQTRKNVKLPSGGHWGYSNDWRYELEDLDELTDCNCVLFILDADGRNLK